MLKHISYTAASSYKTIDLSFMSLAAEYNLIFLKGRTNIFFHLMVTLFHGMKHKLTNFILHGVPLIFHGHH